MYSTRTKEVSSTKRIRANIRINCSKQRCKITTTYVCDKLLESEEPLLIYHIEAIRFVHHMVRSLVGTMIQVGQGKQTVEEFVDMLENPTTEKNGHGAAAKGLILEKVRYK